MDLALLVLLIAGLAVLGYVFWKRRNEAEARREREAEHARSRPFNFSTDHRRPVPETTRTPVRPPIRTEQRYAATPKVTPVRAPAVSMSRPKAQGELRRMEATEYNGQRYYRDTSGDYYNSQGARIDQGVNPLLYAALGGLATFALMSAFDSRSTQAAPTVPVTPYGGYGDSSAPAIATREHSVDAWSKPAPVLEEDRVMDVPEPQSSSFREERVQESSFREDRYDSTPSFTEERSSSFSESFSTDTSSPTDTGGGFSSE